MFNECNLEICGWSKRLKKRFCLVLAAVLFPMSVSAGVYVKDGDSLSLNGREIRLLGIDAPEYRQVCDDASGRKYDCGEKAKDYLKSLVKGKKVSCRKIAVDIYKRELSKCYAGKTYLNRKMLEVGWAVVYRSKNKRYKEWENEARENKRGMWQGKFMRPELHRILNK